MLTKMDKELSKIKKCFKQAQKRQKLYYDKTKRQVQFEEGDLVFLQVKPTNSFWGKTENYHRILQVLSRS